MNKRLKNSKLCPGSLSVCHITIIIGYGYGCFVGVLITLTPQSPKTIIIFDSIAMKILNCWCENKCSLSCHVTPPLHLTQTTTWSWCMAISFMIIIVVMVMVKMMKTFAPIIDVWLPIPKTFNFVFDKSYSSW